MKHKKMSKKLVFKKETISDLALKEVRGGFDLTKPTLNYSECGTGPATIMPCMC